MKKTSLFIILILLALLSSAQHTDKGRSIFVISTGIPINAKEFDSMNMFHSTQKIQNNTHNTTERKGFIINLQPEWGYFVSDNVLLGLSSNLDYSKSWQEQDSYIYSGLGTGPLLRFFFPFSKILPYFELKCSYSLYRRKSSNNNEFTSSQIIMLGSGLGVDIPLGRKIALDISVSYQQLSRSKLEGSANVYKIKELALKIGFCMFLGLDE